MNWIFEKRLAVSLILTANTAAFGGTPSGETTEPLPTIKAGVYNLARVERNTLEGAKQQTARILWRAGVKLDLLDCRISAEEADEYPGCSALRGDAAIFLRVRTSSTSLSGRSNVYGVALLPEDGGFGKYADVYADGTGVLSQGKAPLVSVLGALLAHEIGHLLLGRASHSVSGIMSSPWRGNDLLRAAQGALLFTPKDTKRLQDGVRDRMRSDEAARIRAGS